MICLSAKGRIYGVVGLGVAIPLSVNAQSTLSLASFVTPRWVDVAPLVSPETATTVVLTLPPQGTLANTVAPEDLASAETLLTQSFQGLDIQQVNIIGNTIFADEIQTIAQPLIGTTPSRQTIEAVTNEIYELYFNRGYLTTTAHWEYQIETKTLIIQVLEGQVTEIKVEGTQRLVDYVRSRIARGVSTPLNTAQLEDHLRLLEADPLFDKVSGSLRKGEGKGESIVIIQVVEADPFAGGLQFDNYSPPSIGAERLKLDLVYRNLTGRGDTIATSYRPRTAAPFETWRLEIGYQVPLNALNGTLAWRSVIDRNAIIQDPFDVLDIRGEAERHQLIYRQPVIRSSSEELAFSLGFTYHDSQTFTFAGPTPFTIGPDRNGHSRTRSIDLGQDYTQRGANGTWAVRSLLRFGIGVLDATDNPDPIPDSQFFAWLGQLQRLQVINPNNFFIAELDWQLTPHTLLSTEQFIIGGGESVRGYRQNALAGDNGFRVSLEDRIILERHPQGLPKIQLAPFLDAGAVWNVGDNPNSIVDSQQFIIALGLGVLWQPIEGLNVRIDYAPPLIELDTRGNNLQDDGLYVSVDYRF